MSVWFTETFTGQLFWDLARFDSFQFSDWAKVVKLTDVTFVGGKLDETDVSEAVIYPTGKARDLVDDPRQVGVEFRRIFWEHCRTQNIRKDAGHVTRAALAGVDTVITGLKGVYSLFLDLDDLPGHVTDSRVAGESMFVKNFMEHAFRSQAALLHTVPGVCADVWSRVDQASLKSAARWHVLAEMVRAMITLRHKGAYKRGMVQGAEVINAADDPTIDLPAGWSVFFDGWITYVRSETMEDNVIFALTSADLDRVQQMCISRAMLELHHATWATTAGTDLTSYLSSKRAMLDVMKAALRKSVEDGSNPNVLCQDFRKVFNAYLSMAAGPLAAEGTKVMLKEIKDKHHDRLVNVPRYLQILRRTPFDLAQDIGRLYKLLPAPDYDIGESFSTRAAAASVANPVVPVEGDNPCNMEEFRLYLRKHMAGTLVAANGGKGVGKFKGPIPPAWFRQYLDKGSLPSNLALYDLIDFTGTMPYVERHAESVVSWKDTACCEENFDDAIGEADEDVPRRNMLLRYLFDDMCPTPDRARTALKRAEHVHRAGFKMESHKTSARIFYIGNLSDRLVQSEMEENVHRVALHSPGYMIGQTPEFTTRKTMKIVAPSLQTDEKVYFLNFDIAQWSPGMNASVQRISHELWGEVFNRPEFANAHRINEGAKVVLNKRGYAGWYINKHANFEGYNGKEMTFLHGALMGYSAYRYRRGTGHVTTVDLCAYIDDGLAGFKDKAVNGPVNFLSFVDHVEQTYKSIGFLLERSKCYMSEKFAIFLNEIYLGGRKITYGLRAIMRVGTTAFEDHQTLGERLNAYFAGSQGAMKAGMDMVAAALVSYYLMARLFRSHKMGNWLDAKAGVLYMLTPRALGGAGVPHIVGLMTNLLSDGLTEGISAIKELARAYPDYKPKVISLLRQHVSVKSNVSILVSPKSAPASSHRMIESRLSSAISEALLKKDLSIAATRFLSTAKKMDLEGFADAVIGQAAVVVPAVLDDILAGTPYALLMSLVKKFESARTMTSLVGKATMHRIVVSNAEDMERSMKYFAIR